MTRHDPRSEFHEELAALLAKLRPELVAICLGHCLTPKETEDVIYENSFLLARRWDRMQGEERSELLLAAVEEHCRRLSERRAADTQEN